MKQHPIQELILHTYGSIAEFARASKITYATAHRQFHNPDAIRYGQIAKMCKRSKINLTQFIIKGVGDE